MTADRSPGDSGDLSAFAAYEDDLRKTEKKIAGEIDPGARAVVVAICVMLAMISLMLPHTKGVTGFDVLLFSSASRDAGVTLPSWIFVYLLVIFGIAMSGLALITRRWVIAWIALCGCAVASVEGVFSIWIRNTANLANSGPTGNLHTDGPGIGLYLGWLVAMTLTFHWARIVWARSAYQQALEKELRAEAAKREAFRLSLQQTAKEINAQQRAAAAAETANGGAANGGAANTRAANTDSGNTGADAPPPGDGQPPR